MALFFPDQLLHSGNPYHTGLTIACLTTSNNEDYGCADPGVIVPFSLSETIIGGHNGAITPKRPPNYYPPAIDIQETPVGTGWKHGLTLTKDEYLRIIDAYLESKNGEIHITGSADLSGKSSCSQSAGFTFGYALPGCNYSVFPVQCIHTPGYMADWTGGPYIVNPMPGGALAIDTTTPMQKNCFGAIGALGIEASSFDNRINTNIGSNTCYCPGPIITQIYAPIGGYGTHVASVSIGMGLFDVFMDQPTLEESTKIFVSAVVNVEGQVSYSSIRQNGATPYVRYTSQSVFMKKSTEFSVCCTATSYVYNGWEQAYCDSVGCSSSSGTITINFNVSDPITKQLDLFGCMDGSGGGGSWLRPPMGIIQGHAKDFCYAGDTVPVADAVIDISFN